MADDQFQLGSGNWWDHTSRSPPASISTTLNAIASFSGGGSEQSSAVDGGVLATPDLQMMGLGLSSNNMDWNQALFRGEKCEGSFRSLVQEDISSSSNTFQPPESVSSSQEHWRNKLFSGDNSSDHQDTSSITDFKSRFSIDNQSQFSSQASSNDESTISSAAYGLFLPPENQQQQQMSNYPYQSSGGAYGANAAELVPNWSKYPPFLRTSPPKQSAGAASSSSHLHFSNNTPFWNASSPPAAMADGRPSFFPALQGQVPPAPSFDEKPKTLEIRDSGATTKKNSNETSNKRPRNDTPSTLPAFKVRKEKMGDRITALQQLVSPFGKTDTASVLSEAIEYIKFLHEQVSVLSNPYMKNGAPIQQQQNFDKSKDLEGPNRDLRSRGLCLVPVSSTFPMTHETTNDFWTPTFGGTFR